MKSKIVPNLKNSTNRRIEKSTGKKQLIIQKGSLISHLSAVIFQLHLLYFNF